MDDPDRHCEHAPGPWRISASPDWPFLVYDAGGRFVASAQSHGARSPATENANARLIAAAPDLLHACRLALDGPYAAPEVREVLRAAVARASGGTNAREVSRRRQTAPD